MNRARCVVAVALTLCCLHVTASEAVAQEVTSRDRLREVTTHLVPYSTGGTTLEALGELAVLSRSFDPRTAATARFLRAAAAVDLLVYSNLNESSSLPSELAEALGTNPTEMINHIDSELSASRGSFAEQAASCHVVLSCASREDWSRCMSQLRDVADSGRAGATAARLMLFERMVRAAEQARSGPPARATALLVEQGTQLCAAPRSDTVARHCSAAEGERDELLRQAALVRAVVHHATQDLQVLRRFASGGDPLARLSSTWLEQAVDRMGWSILPQPFTATSFTNLTLPPSSSPATLPPLELLVVSRSGVSVALTPATVATVTGPVQLDERAGFSLPGREVVSLPARFRAVIRPVPQVTSALRELREGVARTLQPLGENGPTWLAPERPVLGLLVDRDVGLIDLARYVASAQRAGYERFALLGMREDGRLGVVPAEFGTLQAGPEPSDLPRLRVGPREMSFTPSEGNAVTVSRDDFAGSATTWAGQLSSGRRSFAAQGRIALSFGVVFPAIDAIMSSAPSSTPPVFVLLPP